MYFYTYINIHRQETLNGINVYAEISRLFDLVKDTRLLMRMMVMNLLVINYLKTSRTQHCLSCAAVMQLDADNPYLSVPMVLQGIKSPKPIGLRDVINGKLRRIFKIQPTPPCH